MRQIVFRKLNNAMNFRLDAFCHTILRNLSVSTQTLHSEETNESREYDIIISGGGMVGFATGCALGRSSRLENKRILLLEKQRNRSWALPDDYSNRVCALNAQTQQLFSSVGAWEHILQMRVQPVKKMQVWESCSEAMISFDEHDIGDRVAHIVENDVILDALKKRIPSNVEVEYEANVSGYELPSTCDDQVTVTLEGGETLHADLLIGADGASSGVRKAMQCRYLGWEYDQMGIVATLKLSEEQDNFTAWQKFLSTGPIALLPLSENRSSLVWSTTRANASHLMSLSEPEFIDELNSAIWKDEAVGEVVKTIHEKWQDLLQVVVPPSKGPQGTRQLPPCISDLVPKSRGSFPLGLGHAAHYVAPRVALIGDAAHRVHPLAGQGVNLGFGDVTCLKETLENAVLRGTDIGDPRELHRYETIRQRHNVSLMAAVDALYRLYSTSFTPLVLLRSLGLSAVDSLSPLKKRIMAHAEG